MASSSRISHTLVLCFATFALPLFPLFSVSCIHSYVMVSFGCQEISRSSQKVLYGRSTDAPLFPLPPPLWSPIFSRSHSSADDADAVGPLAELALPFSGPHRPTTAARFLMGCSSGLLMCLACGVLVGLTASAPLWQPGVDVCAVFPVSTAIPYRADAGSTAVS